MIDQRARKVIRWVGSSRKDLRRFPREVRRDLGIALDAAQLGELYPNARPLKGFHGASVIEIRSSFRTDAYRTVYTTQFGEDDLCAACVSEESEARHRDTEAGDRDDQGQA